MLKKVRRSWPASIVRALLVGGCAFESPNTHFQLAAGCFQLPARAASDGTIQLPFGPLVPRSNK
ncbi:hypothetical protein C7401_13564 [Paraburkholderia unamae]|uniref:hypothetical protein n=1 Tax=Paraburkholderia unamae TaxID=219649 RepID=UPI000DC54A11|nr:hypothetical protein [Paraburkholderia unamae]RAR51901.1 hypothetical protein C7401_13564 [Paraburkholderia unamae]